MQVVREWFQLRRETLRNWRWLRPALLFVDVVLIGLGFVVSPPSGVVLGLLGIIINELLSPVIVRRIFIKELHVQTQAVASIETKVIRRQSNDVYQAAGKQPLAADGAVRRHALRHARAPHTCGSAAAQLDD